MMTWERRTKPHLGDPIPTHTLHSFMTRSLLLWLRWLPGCGGLVGTATGPYKAGRPDAPPHSFYTEVVAKRSWAQAAGPDNNRHEVSGNLHLISTCSAIFSQGVR